MSDDQTQPRSGRRSSFAGQTFADLFGTGRPSISKPSADNGSPPTQQLPGPISQAAAQAHARRMSLTTIGLSGSPNQTSPFNSYRSRRDSLSSANSGSMDESAIAEDDGPASAAAARDTSAPSTPFARRTSFGARALRDIRTASFGGGGGGAPGSPGQNGRTPPPAASSGAAGRQAASSPPQTGTISSRDSKGRGSSSEGFNWSDNFRTRAERTSSIVGGVGGGGAPAGGGHARAKSVAVMEPPPAAQIPKPKEQKRPDAMQERILKGDFYMD